MKEVCPLCNNKFECKLHEPAAQADKCWCNKKEYKQYISRIPSGLNGCICSECMVKLPEKK